MDKNKIEAFTKIPQVPQSDWGFIEDIKSPLEYHTIIYAEILPIIPLF